MAQWYVVRNDKEHGPFDDGKLKRLATEGKLKADDFVRRSDTPTLKKAKEIKGLFASQLPASEQLPPVATANDPSPVAPPSKQPPWLKVILLLAVCGSMVRFAFVARERALQEYRKDLMAANELWDSGDKAAAISKYRAVVVDHPAAVPESEAAIIYGRVLDSDAEAGNQTAVEELLSQAERREIRPTVSSAIVRNLLATREEEQREMQERKKLAQKSSPAPKVGKRRVYDSENEFRGLVMGRTPEEVVSAVGKPDYVHGWGRFTNGQTYEESWAYMQTIEHPATGKERLVTVFFRDGHAIETNVEGG
jgi:hypothetical protein